MGNNHVFKDVISDYEIARPGYPIELFNDIVDFSILKKDRKILEIGYSKNGKIVVPQEVRLYMAKK
jgi:hypothetical protein